MKKLICAQLFILLAGTAFAWSNFAYELYRWMKAESCTACALTASGNPFLSACFFGALFFTAAFCVGIVLRNKIYKLK
jgi:hypothetical protein